MAQGQGSGGGGSTNSGSGGGGGNSGTGGAPLLPTIALKIPNETAPPGGVAQMKFLNTEPTPISSGRPHMDYDSSIFDDVWGIQLFNPSADLNGVAIVNGSSVWIDFICNGPMTGTDYPVMTMALHVRPNAAVGSQTQFDIDPQTTWTVGYLPAIMKTVAPATVTVAGSVSITNVVPGGGMLPAGSIVKVQGLGFQPRTSLQVNGIQTQSVKVVSSTEIDIVLAQPGDMTGKRIQVVNPDGSQDFYYSYMRGIDLGVSNQSMLANAIPIFSAVKHSKATFAPIGAAQSSQFTGLAMQNQNLSAANVTVTLYSANGKQLGSSTISLPSGYRLMREVSELTGATPPLGSYVVVSSDSSIQMFGFLADTGSNTITPFVAAAAL